MLVLLLPIAAALVGTCAYLVVSMAAPRTRVGRWLALWIAAWAEVVLTVEVLSVLDAVTPLGFLICYAVFGGIAVVVWLKRGRPHTRLLRLPARSQIGEAARRHPVLAVLLVVLAVCALANLLLAVAVPVNNHDAMSYHLSRVGYWIQHGSTDPYFTHNARQNHMPPNAEFGVLSAIIFARAEWPAPLGQFAAYFVCLAAVYIIARQTGASDAGALFAALLLGTMTEIVLQASVPKNDLIVSSFLACAVAFVLVGLGGGDRSHAERIGALVWSGLATGLAVGTKPTALLFLPGLAVAGVVIALGGGRRSRWLRRLTTWAGCCVVGGVLLGSFNYIRVLVQPAAPYEPVKGSRPARAKAHGVPARARPASSKEPHLAPGALIERPTVRSLADNLARYGYHLCDFGGLWPRRLAWALTRARARAGPRVFAVLGLAANAPELNVPGEAGAFPVDDETGWFDATPHLHEDLAWYGPIAFLIGLPLVLAHLVYSPVRRHWARFAVALMPVMYWLFVATLLRYAVWNGRYFVTAAVAGAPLLALAYRPKALRRARSVAMWLLALVATSTAVTATFYNSAKPVFPKRVREEEELEPLRGARGILTLPRVLARSRYVGPDMLLVLQLPAEVFPEKMVLGVVLGGDDCDWLLFGPRLSRRLVPLPRNAARIEQAVKAGTVDMVLIRCDAAPLQVMRPIIGERPVLLLAGSEAGSRSRPEAVGAPGWTFVVRNKDDPLVFFPTRDWIMLDPQAWVGPDQQYVPVKRFGEGHVDLVFEPNSDILRDTPLVFEFHGQGHKLLEVTAGAPGPQRIRLEWRPGPAVSEQLLRVRVRAVRPQFELERAETARVYRIVMGPVFRPAPSDR